MSCDLRWFHLNWNSLQIAVEVLCTMLNLSDRCYDAARLSLAPIAVNGACVNVATYPFLRTVVDYLISFWMFAGIRLAKRAFVM